MMTPSKHILVALVALASLASACRPTITCEDTGCAFNQVCDTDTGECRLRSRDCRENPDVCGENELCNERTGQCFSRGIECGPGQAQCPRGQVCNAERGICELEGRCLNDSDCSEGETCDVSLGECAPLPCEVSDQCPREFVCQSLRCEPGCDPNQPRCGLGRFCRARDGDEFGNCASECTIDTECANGFRCALESSPAQCVQEGPCDDDADCRSDEGCVDNACVATPCERDEDCLDGELCDAASGVCYGGDCVEDTFSPNHSAAQAATIELGALTNISMCPGRPDWFAVDLDAGEFVRVDLRHPIDADLDLHLFDDDLRVLRADEGLESRASVVYQARDAQRVLVRVSTVGLQEASYELSLTRDSEFACTDDPLEQNDTQADAREVTPTPMSPVDLPLTVCYDDEDWFVVRNLSAESGLTLEPSTSDADLDLVAELLTPDGERYAFSEELTLLRLGTSGDYWVRALSATARSGDYDLAITPLVPLTCVDINTQNTPESARALEIPGVETPHVLCPNGSDWEIEWFTLPSAEASSTLDLSWSSTDSLEMRATLFEVDAEGGTTLLTASAPGASALSALVEPEQTLLLRMTSNNLPNRLFELPTYRLTWNVTPR